MASSRSKSFSHSWNSSSQRLSTLVRSKLYHSSSCRPSRRESAATRNDRRVPLAPLLSTQLWITASKRRGSASSSNLALTIPKVETKVISLRRGASWPLRLQISRKMKWKVTKTASLCLLPRDEPRLSYAQSLSSWLRAMLLHLFLPATECSEGHSQLVVALAFLRVPTTLASVRVWRRMSYSPSCTRLSARKTGFMKRQLMLWGRKTSQTDRKYSWPSSSATWEKLTMISGRRWGPSVWPDHRLHRLQRNSISSTLHQLSLIQW